MKLLPYLVFVTIFLLAIFPVEDYDIWQHIKTGEIILQTKSIPSTDIFSYASPSSPWIVHSWLSEIIFFIIYRLTGINGIIIFKALIITATFYLLYASLSKRDIQFLTLIIPILLGVGASQSGWDIRPQIFTFLLLAVFIWIMDRFKEGNIILLIIIPFITVLWVNLHNGFIIGAAFLFFICAGELTKFFLFKDSQRQALKPIIILFIITFSYVIFSLLNPHTYKALIYPFFFKMSSIPLFLSEWQSPGFWSAPLYWVMLIVTGFSLYFSLKRKMLTDVIIYLVFGYLSVSAFRNIPLFCIVSVPILAKNLESLLSTVAKNTHKFEKNRHKFLSLENLIAVIIFLFLLTAFNSGNAGRLGIKEKEFPVQAVDFIEKVNIEGNMFNDFDWGSYIVWRLWPQRKVFILGTSIDEKLFLEYFSVVEALPFWEKILDKYNVNYILIKSHYYMGSKLPLLYPISESPHWKLIYADVTSFIFIKNHPENQHIIEKYNLPKERILYKHK